MMRHICLFLCHVMLAHLTKSCFAAQWGPLNRCRRPKLVTSEETTSQISWSEFEQKLDHFTPDSIETWHQRYLVNMTSYRANGVVFLWIDGEWEGIDWALKETSMAQYAQMHGAAKFSLEHRFYGFSRPKSDLATDSLRYLSSKQAIADLAYFITKMNDKFNFSNPKWIVFGCSYPGSLAAWVRYKYPHLVYAAVSSSGPSYFKVNFHEYADGTAASLALTGGQECVDAIKAANVEMSKNMSKHKKRKQYQKLFRLCDPMEDNEKDIARFFGFQAEHIIGHVKSNKVRPGRERTAGTIDNQAICEIMNNKSIGDPVHRYAELNKLFLDNFLKAQCWNHSYSKHLAELKNTAYHQESTENEVAFWRQWVYQLCTELGLFIASTGQNDTFGYSEPLKFHFETCSNAYGPRFDESLVYEEVEWTNSYYGGRSIPVSRVIFVQGSRDPVSALGITANPPPGSYAIFINGTSHCEDVFAQMDDDPQELKEARSLISEILGRWIHEEKHTESENLNFYF